mmetsp:Transcript_138485/g.386311  ORF Transcript_138485/g.386311 Transcript_138485/m.386311 type:complete len:201 (+) Transcript_138485:992-1594(+)
MELRGRPRRGGAGPAGSRGPRRAATPRRPSGRRSALGHVGALGRREEPTASSRTAGHPEGSGCLGAPRRRARAPGGLLREQDAAADGGRQGAAGGPTGVPAEARRAKPPHDRSVGCREQHKHCQRRPRHSRRGGHVPRSACRRRAGPWLGGRRGRSHGRGHRGRPGAVGRFPGADGEGGLEHVGRRRARARVAGGPSGCQ